MLFAIGMHWQRGQNIFMQVYKSILNENFTELTNQPTNQSHTVYIQNRNHLLNRYMCSIEFNFTSILRFVWRAMVLLHKVHQRGIDQMAFHHPCMESQNDISIQLFTFQISLWNVNKTVHCSADILCWNFTFPYNNIICMNGSINGITCISFDLSEIQP